MIVSSLVLPCYRRVPQRPRH